MNVTLEPALEEFIRRKVQNGEFGSAEEVVSAGLRLLQAEQDSWRNETRRKVDEGWSQSEAGQFRTPEEVQANLAAQKEQWRRGRDPA